MIPSGKIQLRFGDCIYNYPELLAANERCKGSTSFLSRITQPIVQFVQFFLYSLSKLGVLVVCFLRSFGLPALSRRKLIRQLLRPTSSRSFVVTIDRCSAGTESATFRNFGLTSA